MLRNWKKRIRFVLHFPYKPSSPEPCDRPQKDDLQEPEHNGAFVYGPWFGIKVESWSTDLKEISEAVSLLAAALLPILPCLAAQYAATEISIACQAYSFFGKSAHTHLFGTVQKSYRQAYDPDGSLVYLESHYEIHSYLIDTKGNTRDLGITTETYKGTRPARQQ